MTRTRSRSAGALLTVLALGSLAACGGDDEPAAEPSPAAPRYDTPREAYEAVVQAYAAADCDTAAQLVDGTEQGIEQFLGGCERRENVDVIRTIEVTGEPRPTLLDPLPESVSEAVRLTAAFTAESGENTDYSPEMVRVDGAWKLWLPGDERTTPSPSPAPEESPAG